MKKTMLVVGGLLLLVLALPTVSKAQCPAYGFDTTCGVVITVTNGGATVVATGQGPYDGVEDTLVGVVNNSSSPISSLVLTSSADIFNFDGDGIDTYGAPSNVLDTSYGGYGGPDSYFTGINGTDTSGTVDFVTPLSANGGSTYFSLEEALSGATLPTVSTSTPEPGTLLLLGSGVLGLIGLRPRRGISAS